MDFLLLGIDSLIACIAVGPMIRRRWSVPFAVLFGICDGAGFLLGTAFHWSMPDSLSNITEVVALGILGLYWIGIAIFSRQAALADQQSRPRWGVWVLPFVLSVDNITYGLVDGVSKSASVWQSAGEQALSSAILAGIGLVIGTGIAYTIPALRRRMALAQWRLRSGPAHRVRLHRDGRLTAQRILHPPSASPLAEGGFLVRPAGTS
jgi:putative Mn2+ efflux pump MntP